MKKFSLFLYFAVVYFNSSAQDSLSISVLTAAYHIQNPIDYLSTISPSKVPTHILIDRTHYDSLLILANGTSQVATISSTFWYQIFNQMKYANYDSTRLPDPTLIDQIVEGYYQSEKIYSIGVLDFKFNRITQASLSNGVFVELDSSLQDVGATAASFSTERIVVASCMSENVQGDEIKFLLNDLLYYSNVDGEQLVLIQVDFNNGQGYQTVTLNEPVTITYGPQSGFLLIKVKLTYENTSTHQLHDYIAHSTVFRVGSDAVPLPDSITNGSTNGRLNNNTVQVLYYPEKVNSTNYLCVPKPLTGQMVCRTVPIVEGGDLEVYMLLAPGNNSGKLRRPFIVTDGFDPDNKRDYFANRIKGKPTVIFMGVDLSNIPRANDFRGLYELLNGDPSPWYDGQPSANLINQLRTDGYDIVIVNFTYGDGDINDNAYWLRRFLRDVINGPTYRDSKTEEAILVGPSMGGLITRIVLTEMEAANEQHYVKTWYSFDSPHKGAYIPLALQHTINFLAKINTGGNGKLENAKQEFQNSERTLKSTAARQMLFYHFSETGGSGHPDEKFTAMQTKLNNLGFPRQTKNYAISNGGKSKLYPNEGALIVDFGIEKLRWTWALGRGLSNVDGDFLLFMGSRQGFNNDEEYSTQNQIGFENSVGGWNSALYSLNCNSGNKYQKAETDIPFVKASFIVTSSAFGMPITRSTVYKTWENYTAEETPFDVIKGMNQTESDEHVRISPATATFLINELRTDFTNSTRPRIRPGQPLSQTIKGAVAYRTKETLTFAGSGNSFTADNTSKIEITAGTSVTWSPGFFAKSGSDVKVTIATVGFGTPAKMAGSTPIRFAYSPFLGQIDSYLEEAEESEELSDAFSAFPNPFNQTTTLSLPDTEKYQGLRVVNAMGVIMFADDSVSPGPYVLNLAAFSSGFYSVVIRMGNNRIRVIKILKQ